MPTTKRYGDESENNKKIGGLPTIYYFDFQSKGRGQEYAKFKETKLSQMNPTAKIPVVKLNGKILVQSYAILRHLARQLGAYDGETEEGEYWAEAMCDIAIDWRALFVTAYFSDDVEKNYGEHKAGPRPNFLKALDQHLSSHEASQSGPYVIGKKIIHP
ncbi:hypothetical protein H2203_000327 [Taxawa tesnikishii (nom. ined.)]|nr:hypothetical protein H2203_000327 [Dothideales sp. JES 119]